MERHHQHCAVCGLRWNVSRLRNPQLAFVCPVCEARALLHPKGGRAQCR